MNCIIIEDEQHAADYLEYLLKRTGMDIEVVYKAASIKKATHWLMHNTPDLIFLDVQLSDGISFSIFDHIQIYSPIIFTTSHTEYAIEAFKLNSIAYLLKPIDPEELRSALNKYQLLKQSYPAYQNLSRLASIYQKRFLVETSSTIHTFNDADIAYFFVQNRQVFIQLYNGQLMTYNQTLEWLDQRLDPSLFFRINRQFIVSRNAIKKMTHETRGRVKIEAIPPSKDEMIVSIDRASSFREWLHQ